MKNLNVNSSALTINVELGDIINLSIKAWNAKHSDRRKHDGKERTNVCLLFVTRE